MMRTKRKLKKKRLRKKKAPTVPEFYVQQYSDNVKRLLQQKGEKQKYVAGLVKACRDHLSEIKKLLIAIENQ